MTSTCPACRRLGLLPIVERLASQIARQVVAIFAGELRGPSASPVISHMVSPSRTTWVVGLPSAPWWSAGTGSCCPGSEGAGSAEFGDVPALAGGAGCEGGGTTVDSAGGGEPAWVGPPTCAVLC